MASSYGFGICPSLPSPPLNFSFHVDTTSFNDPYLFDIGLPTTGYTAGQYATPPQPVNTHSRSSSRGSLHSTISTPDSVCTRLSTPPRASPPVHQHGALLLPKIRPQDQNVDTPPPPSYQRGQSQKQKRQQQKQQTQAAAHRVRKVTSAAGSTHVRSRTNPETLSNFAYAQLAFTPTPQPQQPRDLSNSLLCSPADFAPNATSMAASPSSDDNGHDDQEDVHGLMCRSSSADGTMDRYRYSAYDQTPLVQPDFGLPPTFLAHHHDNAPFQLMGSMDMSAASLNTASLTPEPEATPSTTLAAFLTSPNPAASLVHTVSFPHRDPTIKHFWWDVRNVRSWSGFNVETIMALPGAANLLNAPVPIPSLVQPTMPARHPETEAALHSIYASYYLPKLNSALAQSSGRPLQLSAPSPKSRGHPGDLIFTANPVGESSTASAMFGGKPTARVVGLVRAFDRFNTGMRAESNIKRVEYLRGLAALHHAMREHGCRYGFILTEIELVLVRNGTEATPFFGDVEITSVQLAAASHSQDQGVKLEAQNSESTPLPPLTACLALWGICQLASGDMHYQQQLMPTHPHWKSEIGAPAEGTRRKALAKDSWIPAPQLAEKREAKRSRGWVWPEDAVGRKELGKRGVRYNGV